MCVCVCWSYDCDGPCVICAGWQYVVYDPVCCPLGCSQAQGRQMIDVYVGWQAYVYVAGVCVLYGVVAAQVCCMCGFGVLMMQA